MKTLLKTTENIHTEPMIDPKDKHIAQVDEGKTRNDRNRTNRRVCAKAADDSLIWANKG